MDMNKKTQKVNRTNMLHEIYNYLFVQHLVQQDEPLSTQKLQKFTITVLKHETHLNFLSQL